MIYLAYLMFAVSFIQFVIGAFTRTEGKSADFFCASGLFALAGCSILK